MGFGYDVSGEPQDTFALPNRTGDVAFRTESIHETRIDAVSGGFDESHDESLLFFSWLSTATTRRCLSHSHSHEPRVAFRASHCRSFDVRQGSDDESDEEGGGAQRLQRRLRFEILREGL